MLVTSLASFLGYQRESAWTWEHQALTRARAVAGKVQIRDAFEIGRREILTQPRAARKMRHDLAGLRSKMHNELDSYTDAPWDLKQGKGGLTHIKSITPYPTGTRCGRERVRQ